VVVLTLRVLEAGSGLVATADAASAMPSSAPPPRGTALVLQSVDAPASQWLTVPFDASNASGADGSTYTLRAMLPEYAWTGQWVVAAIVLGDGAGNSVQYSARDLADRGWVPRCFVGNTNLTYHGDDLFHYTELGVGEADADGYSDDDGYYGDDDDDRDGGDGY
jgi:hypothetical protein